MGRYAHWVSAGVLIALLSVAAAAEPKTKPKFTVAKDTTYVTEPLLPDGRPDYAEAMNRQYGKGVTRKNNAAIGFIEAFGPAFVPAKRRAQVAKRLGIRIPPAEGKYVKEPTSISRPEDNYYPALRGPWRRDDYRRLARHLQDISPALDKLVVASRNPRYFFPVTTADDTKAFYTALIPTLRLVRTGAEMLIARAHLSIGEGRPADAWPDLLAAHRLGRVLDQGPFLIQQLVSIAVGAKVDDATRRFVLSERPPEHMLKEMLRVLPRSQCREGMARSIGEERYALLDAALLMANDPTGGALGDLIGLGVQEPGERKALLRGLRRKLDAKAVNWDQVLRRINGYYDRVVEAAKSSDVTAHRQALAAMDKAGQQAGREMAMNPKGRDAAYLTRQQPGVNAATRWAGSVILGLMLPNFGKAIDLADRGDAQRRMTRLTLALAIHQAEHGRYPGRLAALAPKILKQLPKDPFTGKGFVYRRRGRGYLLYSVGDNGKDDGGRDKSRKGDDLVVRARR